jgi:hypothetical protein
MCLLFSQISNSARGQGQRIPRQSVTSTAVLEDIVRTDAGLGQGGVNLVLEKLLARPAFTIMTTGDGTFRFLDLLHGPYRSRATRDGFEPFTSGMFELAAGEIHPIEFSMKAISSGSEGLRVVPRQPGLGPAPPASPGEPAAAAPYGRALGTPPPANVRDFATAAGAAGFEAPPAMRADRIIDQGVRLPYLKFPRNPVD